MVIVPIPYSADPAKDQEWLLKEKARYLSAGEGVTEEDFNREYLIDFRLQKGRLAYPNFRETAHMQARIDLVKGVPLGLFCDFNVDPMVWGTFQIVHGWLFVLRVFSLSPALTPLMVQEFRNFYPSHSAEVIVYGDATGSNRDHQTGKSDYDLIRNGLVGYNAPIEFRIPDANPLEKDRLNAVNAKLKPAQGAPGLKMDARYCGILKEDFEGVILDPRGKIAKTYDSKNPYSRLTHASDGLGYVIHREWPAGEVKISRPQATKPLKYGRLIGDFPK